jgi:hypothetical protein
MVRLGRLSEEAPDCVLLCSAHGVFLDSRRTEKEQGWERIFGLGSGLEEKKGGGRGRLDVV